MKITLTLTESDIQAQMGMMGKAVQQCGVELAQQGIGVLDNHVAQVTAILGQFQALQAAIQQAQAEIADAALAEHKANGSAAVAAA